MNSEHLRSFFDRWSRLEDEKQGTSDDLKDLFSEAKGVGFNTKAMRAAFRLKRKRDDKTEAFDEAREEVELYLVALGVPSHARDAHEDRDGAATPIVDALAGGAADETPAQIQDQHPEAGTHQPAPPQPKPGGAGEPGRLPPDLPVFLDRRGALQ
jgi:uncharacterized protein (UPF0335 family)